MRLITKAKPLPYYREKDHETPAMRLGLAKRPKPRVPSCRFILTRLPL
jgi:hypothetical protein